LGEVLVVEMGRPEKVLVGEKGKGREQRSGYSQKIGQP
jgi:hypothetical protein